MLISNFKPHKDFFQDRLQKNINSGFFDQRIFRGTGRSTHLALKIMEHVVRKKRVAVVTNSFQHFDYLMQTVRKIALSYSGAGKESFLKNEWWNDDFYPKIFYVQRSSWYEDLLGRKYDVLMIDNEVIDDCLKSKKSLKEFSLDPALELSKYSYSDSSNSIINGYESELKIGDLVKWASGCALITGLSGESGKILDISILYENHHLAAGGDLADFLQKIEII